MRVLICDDEPSVRLLFRTLAEGAGADVVEAIDGDDCLVQAAAHSPDVVILDLFMPGRDGLSGLPDLRATLPDAAVLVVSAHAAVDTFAKSRARGATACFDKLGFLDHLPEVLTRYTTPA